VRTVHVNSRAVPIFVASASYLIFLSNLSNSKRTKMETRRCGKTGVELSAKSQMGRALTASVETHVKRDVRLAYGCFRWGPA